MQGRGARLGHAKAFPSRCAHLTAYRLCHQGVVQASFCLLKACAFQRAFFACGSFFRGILSLFCWVRFGRSTLYIYRVRV